MRGERAANPYNHPRCNRFIPACAGNAGRHFPDDQAETVHPRMRGERCNGVSNIDHPRGSSPHARGTPYRLPSRVSLPRFIPACAGNARSASRPEPSSTVHPRMRGERVASMFDLGKLGGSSPHARGTLLEDNDAQPARRFIPACAGNADAALLDQDRRSVHPRMRGERCVGVRSAARARGSSPHARGTRARFRKTAADIRFIPACAGNAMDHRKRLAHVTVHPRMRGERR